MTDQAGVPAGWYADERNRDRERYWTGSRWRGDQRWRRSRTPRFPGTTDLSDATASSASMPLSGLEAYSPWAVFTVVLAILWAVGSVIVGAVLISRTGQHCNPVCSQTHPRKGVGLAVIAGGLVAAAFITSCAVLHEQAQTIRLQLISIRDTLDASGLS